MNLLWKYWLIMNLNLTFLLESFWRFIVDQKGITEKLYPISFKEGNRKENIESSYIRKCEDRWLRILSPFFLVRRTLQYYFGNSMAQNKQWGNFMPLLKNHLIACGILFREKTIKRSSIFFFKIWFGKGYTNRKEKPNSGKERVRFEKKEGKNVFQVSKLL